MERLANALSPFNTIVAFVVAAVLLLLPPASYGVVAYLNLSARMEREIAIRGQVVNQAISVAPQLWTFQEVRFKELLSPQPYQLESGLLTILEAKGNIVVSVGEAPAWPSIRHARPLYDAGTVVGRLELADSVRGILVNAAWLFLLGAAFSAVAFLTLRVMPLRALRRVNASLEERDVQLGFANSLLTNAMEGSPDGMLVVDKQGKIISYNQRFIELWKIPPALVEARVDEPVLQTVTAQTKNPEEFLAQVRHLYEHPEETSRDRVELEDGRVFERNTRALHDTARNYLGRIWFFRDMTEREALEEAVRKSEQKFRNLVEATTDFIWETDGDGRFVYASPAARGLLGYEPGEILGKTPFDFMPPAEAQRVGAEFAAIVAGKAPFRLLENVIRRKDGREIVVETSGVPVIDAAGRFRGYRGIDRDVTQRKLAQEALQRRDALLHTIALNASDLAAAPSLDEAMPKIMDLLGRTVRADRIAVLEQPVRPNGTPSHRYLWTRPGVAVAQNAELFAADILGAPDVMARLAPLRKGQTVVIDAESASGTVKTSLQNIGAKSVLLVPMTVDGNYRGHVAFDNFAARRPWEQFEIEILRTLTDLVGNAIQRERYVKELRDAMQIVQDTPTILYRIASGPAMMLTYVSQNVRLFGYEPDAFTSSPGLLMTLVHPDDVSKLREALAVATEAGHGPGVVEHRLLTSRGAYRWVENRFSPVRDAGGRLVEIEGMVIDVTERKAAEEKIALLARTDALTGLANRATFVERLRLAFAAARRGAPAFAVHYLDVDRFKNINDTLGHPVGDALLKTLADRLRACTRETDLVARPGGDEFALLQADLADSADAGALAAKIRAALAEPIVIEGSELHVTASIGIAIYTTDVKAPDDLLARADLALYRAKEEGRDQYRFHSEELDQRVREEVTIAEELRVALERGQLELYYQPQVELSSNRIVGMEALLRWNHPARGLLPPMAFLPIAEKTGSIVPIGKWVLDSACAQMKGWREAGIAPRTIAVNVSLAQLKSAAEFVQFVESTLAKWGLTGADLELDVTETMLAHTTLAQNDVLDRLRRLGIKIAIDDFGTKFSSLDYVRSYRVSCLKIPKGMVESATKNADSAALVRAITSIARELNVDVVAQGVESEAQWSFLTATSPATAVQGYFYSKPVPAGGADALLRHGVILPAPPPEGPKTARA